MVSVNQVVKGERGFFYLNSWESLEINKLGRKYPNEGKGHAIGKYKKRVDFGLQKLSISHFTCAFLNFIV